MRKTAAAAALMAAAVAACGTAPSTPTQQRAGNVSVCRQYRTLLLWMNSDAHPTSADATKAVSTLAVLSSEASGKLFWDLSAVSNDMQASRDMSYDVPRAEGDCQRLGVQGW